MYKHQHDSGQTSGLDNWERHILGTRGFVTTHLFWFEHSITLRCIASGAIASCLEKILCLDT